MRDCEVELGRPECRPRCEIPRARVARPESQPPLVLGDRARVVSGLELHARPKEVGVGRLLEVRDDLLDALVLPELHEDVAKPEQPLFRDLVVGEFALARGATLISEVGAVDRIAGCCQLSLRHVVIRERRPGGRRAERLRTFAQQLLGLVHLLQRAQSHRELDPGSQHSRILFYRPTQDLGAAIELLLVIEEVDRGAADGDVLGMGRETALELLARRLGVALLGREDRVETADPLHLSRLRVLELLGEAAQLRDQRLRLFGPSELEQCLDLALQ